ncbi:DUF2225 domain-containing protein [Thermodesulfitimonas sp.]
MNRVTELLAKIPLFKDFTPDGLARLSRHFRANRIPARSVLLEEGEIANRLIIILHGRAGISRRTRQGFVYEAAGPGSVIGVLDVLEQAPATVTVRAEEETIVLSISRQDLYSFLKEHPQEALTLLGVLAGYLRQTGTVLDMAVPPAAPDTEKETAKETVGNQKKNGEMRDSPFYPKQHICPACEAQFTSLSVKSKYVRLTRTDSDFCPYYETINPMFYEVLVCPHCGYAFTEEMPRLTDREKANLATLLPKIRSSLSFSGERNFDVAVESFRLAIQCLEAVGGKKLLLGKLYLKTAWLYRIAGKGEEEQQNLQKALAYLEQSYQTEQSADPTLELNLIYLLGDLNLRLGNEGAAARWFSRILEHPQRTANPAILNRTRDRWYEIRERRKEEGALNR